MKTITENRTSEVDPFKDLDIQGLIEQSMQSVFYNGMLLRNISDVVRPVEAIELESIKSESLGLTTVKAEFLNSGHSVVHIMPKNGIRYSFEIQNPHLDESQPAVTNYKPSKIVDGLRFDISKEDHALLTVGLSEIKTGLDVASKNDSTVGFFSVGYLIEECQAVLSAVNTQKLMDQSVQD